MKAKDLAALAALGVAGFAAYDKFGKKGEEPKTRGKLGEFQSANDGNAGEYRSDMLGQGRSANEGDAGESEARMSKRSRQENDVPDRIMGRDAAGSRFTEKGVSERVMGKDAAGSRFTGRDIVSEKSAAAAPVAEAKTVVKKVSEAKQPIGVNAAGSRFTNRDADAEPDERKFTLPGTQSAMGDFSRAMLPEQRIAAMNEKSGASHSSAKKTEELTAYSKEQAAKDLEKKKKNGTFVPIPQNVKPAVTTPTAVAPTPPLSAAAAAKKRAIDESNFDSDLMKGRRQAVVDTVKNIPANVANAFKPLTKQEIIDQKNYDSQLNRDRREAAFGSVKNLFGFKKGGAVKKMASGGMTSSKMSSKPSTASSRGDGIAQRGKTRGQMR